MKLAAYRIVQTHAQRGERHGLQKINCREVGIDLGLVLIIGFEQLRTIGFSPELRVELVDPVPYCFSSSAGDAMNALSSFLKV